MVSISKAAYYYKSKQPIGDSEIKSYLQALAEQHKRWGFDKMMLKIKMTGKPWNHKRVRRIYCALGLNIRIKPRKRIPVNEAKVLLQPIKPNICWSMDFMSDALYCGRRFRVFNVIDDYNREGLLIEPRYSIPARKVTQLLDVLAQSRGYPDMIRVDNGTEFNSNFFRNWAKQHNVMIHYIQPGKPAQNGFIERFNRTFREDVLDMNWFNSLQEAKSIAQDWLKTYNLERPHESLAGLSPVLFAKQREKSIANNSENSIFEQY